MKPIENDETENLRVNLLTQEIQFAKMLAGNTFDSALKEKHIDKLSIWLKNRTACTEEFTDKDCLRIWKGLFYSMWMSDKPLPQENLANKIAGLLHCFDHWQACLQFYAAFLKTMANEWNGIDQWRIDKFMMLVRRVTREFLRVLQNQNWSDEAVGGFDQVLKKTLLGSDYVPRGLFMHFSELVFEEVAKVSNGQIECGNVTKLLRPFMFYVASQSDYKLIQFVVRSVFNHLLFQSESGREYKEKFDAWKSMNFPGKSIDEMVLDEPEENGEEEEDDDEENGDMEVDDEEEDTSKEQKAQNGSLDPRAGRVDVAMPEIQFDPLEIVKQLEDLKYKKFTRVRNRKCIDRIVTTFKKFSGGIFPIGIQKLDVDRDELQLPDVDEKAEEFLEFENELYGKQRELKKINKRKRKKIVSNQELFDEFQAKSNKIAKIKHEANVWTKEDITKPNSVSTPTKKSKKSKKNEIKESNKKVAVAPKDAVSNEMAADTPKRGKKALKSEWELPLKNGEVEYFVPSKKQQLNGVPRVKKTKNLVETLQISPSKGIKPKANGIQPMEVIETPKKSPKVKKIKPENTTPTVNNVTPLTKKPAQQNNSPKSSEKKVKSTSKLAQTKTSTPNIFVDKATPSSAEKRVKIALKMNQSQEVNEYIRQLKQSPHPYDSAQKPSKGVLKPNLAPSPINPFYKRLIGIE